METPVVIEIARLMQPLDRDPFLIGLGGPVLTPSPKSAPTGPDRTTP
jgi:hypothetical protein